MNFMIHEIKDFQSHFLSNWTTVHNISLVKAFAVLNVSFLYRLDTLHFQEQGLGFVHKKWTMKPLTHFSQW